MVRTAAILVLAILGHGLLMAGGADAVDAPHGWSRPGHVVLAGPSLDCPARDASCFAVQAAVRSAPAPMQLDRCVAPSPEEISGDVAPLRTNIAPSHHPPSVVRALLQVYRI